MAVRHTIVVTTCSELMKKKERKKLLKVTNQCEDEILVTIIFVVLNRLVL